MRSPSTLYRVPSEQAVAIVRLAAARLAIERDRPKVPLDWWESARPEQRPPNSWTSTWYIRGGRGGGKTWTGAHALGEMLFDAPGEYAVVAPNFAQARDVCIEGSGSGLLAVFRTNRAEVERGRSRYIRSWNRSIGDLRFWNGSIVWIDGADDGAPGIQGKNLRGLWADEIGLWKKWQMAWEESIRYAVRLEPAKIVATGTPKRGHALVRSLMKDPSVAKTLVKTLDNQEHLAPERLRELLDAYAGTTLGRQELEGEMLDDAQGALWHRSLFQYHTGVHLDSLRRTVVAVDPAVTSDAESDETGIVVAGSFGRGQGVVLEDCSLRGSPTEWARRAVTAYHRWRADRIVAEANNGGEMVELTLKTIDPTVPVKLVHASKGKAARAEPVAALYEQGKILHVEPLAELEDQCCNWEPLSGDRSPDRLDALVWAMTDLLLVKGWASLSGEAGGIA